jgi:hypothetical protein
MAVSEDPLRYMRRFLRVEDDLDNDALPTGESTVK